MKGKSWERSCWGVLGKVGETTRSVGEKEKRKRGRRSKGKMHTGHRTSPSPSGPAGVSVRYRLHSSFWLEGCIEDCIDTSRRKGEADIVEKRALPARQRL